MSEIDFLPARYREQSSHRRARVLRIGVVALFTGVLVAAGIGQLLLRRGLEQQLITVRQQHEMAQQASQQLALLQTSLSELRAGAELHTYLRHPWPRTRILAAIVTELPQSISLRQLLVTRELDEAARGPAARREITETAEAAAAKLSAAQRDLEALRAETDPARVVVVLQGVADQHTDLHAYLARLNASELFDAVELESIESHDNQETDDSVFRARLVVKPGIGQAGGPLRAEATAEMSDRAVPTTAVAARSHSDG